MYYLQEHPSSYYGMPVLVDREGIGYGPSETTAYQRKNTDIANMLGDCDPEVHTAAYIVWSWGNKKDRTEIERNFAKKYLAQWPEKSKLLNIL